MKLGLSGNLTRSAIASPLTPLFLVAAVLFGLVALSAIPREEEPQISVPMVDILVSADGLKAPDAAELVTKPLEEIVKGINGVEHVYSQTQDDRVMVTARFLTGTKEDDAVLRVHERIRANYNRIPLGIPEPLIVKRGINDVAIVVLTLSAEQKAAEHWSDKNLYELADKVQSELMKVDNVGLTYLSGGTREEISVEPDPEKLNLFGVTLQQLKGKIQGANRSFLAGYVREGGKILQAAAGQTLSGVPDIGLLLLTTRDGRPVYVRDVAKVIVGPSPAEHRVWNSVPDKDRLWSTSPAVSLAFAKRAGANAVVVSEALLSHIEQLKGKLIPDGIRVDVTRDYGKTANDKANELLFHLALATVSIVVLIGFSIGWREAAVTLIVIPTTILLTMFAANLMGYTINRVSLFALIFSIGILVDDAIVVIENIARHWAMSDGRSRMQAAIEAVAEVGNPTIVATLTVIAALLPMMFVSGMMGPYMAPIPANASAAMLFSFFVAMVVAPWAMVKFAPATVVHQTAHEQEGKLGLLYRRFATPILHSRASAKKFLIYVGVATVLVCGLFATRSVTVKLLPFDNKSELEVLVDLPKGASLEDTERALFAAAAVVQQMPEVISVQAYAGTPAPFNFNGLVRHYYLREQMEMGELQVNLADKAKRHRSSHDIALDLRNRLKEAKLPEGSVLKVVEVPPGPPVMSTLLAEIYGPDTQTRRAVSEEIKKIFHSVPYIVDIDDSYGKPRPRLRISIDQDRLEYFGVEQGDVYDTVSTLLGGVPVGYSHRGEDRNPLEIFMRLPKSDLTWSQKLKSTPVPANALPGNRSIVELDDVVHASEEQGTPLIFRRDGHYTDMVTAELAGAYEAPIYGMLDVAKKIESHNWGSLPKPVLAFHGQPENEARPSLLWDGEWEVTFVTFRDMGAAFAIAILGIYILVVAQFKSFKLPLVILMPIPLTLIGIVIGHWLFGAPFTATSMIGFIALAGIIVRNSILLVDFIRHGAGQGKTLREMLLDAGAVRFRPIMLTALAAMIGAATILLDPIFQGLAISLLFGLASSTLLTVLVIPAIYVVLRDADAVMEKKIMKRNVALSVLSLLSLFALPAHAESLEQAWKQAYQTNPGLAARRAELRITEEQITMARTHWQPNVSATTSIGRVYDKTPANSMLPATGSLTPRNYGIEVVQPLFRGFRTIEETSAAQKQALAQYARFQSAEQQLFLNVAAAYLDIVRDQSVVNLTRHNQEVLEQQYKETQKRFELGDVTRTDVMQSQSRAQGARTSLVQAQGQLASDRATYLRFVGTEPDALLAAEVKVDLPQSQEELIEKAVTRNPAVIASSYSKDQADHESDASRGNLLPELNLVGSATRGWEQSEFVPGRQDEARVMLQLKIPLYRAGADYSQIRSSEHKVTERRLELEDVRLAVRQQATSAWQALTTAQSASVSDQAQVEAAASALDGVRKEAKAGTRTTLDILNAEQELLATKVALVQTKRDEAVAMMQVLAAMGALTADALHIQKGE